MIGSYVCGLNSELFLRTDKNFFCLLDYVYAEKQLHFLF